MKILIKEEKTIDITPELLAKAFWSLDNIQQADFFDHLEKMADGNLETQMETVALFTDNLSLNAIKAMAAIGRDALDRIKSSGL